MFSHCQNLFVISVHTTTNPLQIAPYQPLYCTNHKAPAAPPQQRPWGWGDDTFRTPCIFGTLCILRLEEEHIEQVETLTPESVVGNIGGSWGAFLGCSLISLIEVSPWPVAGPWCSGRFVDSAFATSERAFRFP